MSTTPSHKLGIQRVREHPDWHVPAHYTRTRGSAMEEIVAQWLPQGDAVIRAAVARALMESSPYVRVSKYGDQIQYQFFASDRPIPEDTSDQIVQRMPPSARRDLMEWSAVSTPEAYVAAFLSAKDSS